MTDTSYHVVLSDFVCPIWTVYRFWFGVSCLFSAFNLFHLALWHSILSFAHVFTMTITYICSTMFHLFPLYSEVLSFAQPFGPCHLSFAILVGSRFCSRLHLALSRPWQWALHGSEGVHDTTIKASWRWNMESKHPQYDIEMSRRERERERGNCTVQIEIHLNSPKK